MLKYSISLYYLKSFGTSQFVSEENNVFLMTLHLSFMDTFMHIKYDHFTYYDALL